jgi:integrase
MDLPPHDGRPYTSDGFRANWARAAVRAGVENLTFHDLRGTFATRAYESGATDAEVAALTGHGADGQSHAILRRHYLSLNLTLAKECIRKLEQRQIPPSAAAWTRNVS